MAELEALSFSIGGKVDSSSADNVRQLADSLKQLKEATKGFQSKRMLDIAENMELLAQACNSFNNLSGLQSLGKVFSSIQSGMRGLGGKNITNVATNLQNLGSSIKGIDLDDESVAKWEKLSNSLRNVAAVDWRSLSASVRDASKISGASAPSMDGASEVAPTPNGEPDLRSAIASAKELATAYLSSSKAGQVLMKTMSALAFVGSSVASGVYEIGKSLTVNVGRSAVDSVKKFTGAFDGLFKSFARIAMYRAIRAALMAITKGIQEGVNNVYQYSKALNGSLASSMDALASSSLYLKNSLGAMAAPIISAIAPAVQYCINLLVSLLNLINQVFSAFGGGGFFTKAKQASTDFAKSAGSAGKSAGGAAKELKKTIMSFDEIHALTDNKSGGGGGGGGGGGISASDMFEQAPINQAIADWVKQFKDAFAREDWQSCGKMIGDAINAGVNAFDWNGMGSKIGHWLNAGIQIAYYALDFTNFQNIGEKIANFLSSGIAQIDFRKIGGLLVKKFTIIADLLIGALRGTNWKTIGKSVGDFIRGAFDEVSKWISTVDFVQLGKDIVKAIVDAVAGVGWYDLSKSILDAVWGALVAAFQLLGGMAIGLWDNILKPAGKSVVDLAINLVFNPVKGWFKKVLDWFTGGTKVDMKLMKCSVIDATPGKNVFHWIAEKVMNRAELKKDMTGRVTDGSSDNLAHWFASKIKALSDLRKEMTGKITNGSSDNLASWFASKIKNLSELSKNMIGRISNGSSDNTVSWFAGKIKSGAYISKTVYATLSNSSSSSNFWLWLLGKIKDGITSWGVNVRGALSGGTPSTGQRYKGGSFYSGAWHDIPQFATGGSPSHGSMFIAGERGAEMVGHIGSRTEVLNQSQLASVMYTSVVNGMTTAMAGMTNSSVDMASSIYEGVALANGRQNDLLREQNELIRRLLEKEYSVEVTANSMTNALERKGRRDGVPSLVMG